MREKKSAALASALVALSDAILVLASFALAFWIRFYSDLIPLFYGQIPALSTYVPGMVFACLVTLGAFRFLGLYRMPRADSFASEMIKLLKAMTGASLIAMATTFLYRGVDYSRLVFVLAWAIGILVIWLERYALREIQAWAFSRGHLTKNVAIVGTGPMLPTVVDRIESRPGLGLVIKGYIGEGETPTGIAYLGPIEETGRLIRQLGLDVVIVALPFSEHERLLEVLRQTDGLRVEIRFVPDLFGLITTRTEVHDLDGIPLIGLKPFPLDPWGRFFKRLLDMFLSAVFLVIFSPVVSVVSLAVVLESRGGVFYRQERIGRDGRRFTMYKFRSMRADAEKDGPVWGKGVDDPRSTRVGWILRRTGLDEIPQLYNVLRGEMSLIGPRPERPCFVSEFAGSIPGYLDRHRVKSGVTGWAQVNGLRGDTSVEERTEYDIYYVENWSLGLDFRIMLMTIRYVLTQGTGPVSQEMET
ncbi:MAG: undecaprenyl-phosphate glucose phosphotransferase [Candidatus Eisenbacteria bacterium]